MVKVWVIAMLRQHLACLVVLLMAVPCLSSAATPGQSPRTDHAALPESAVPIGMATIDITPDFPVRLAGYADRMQEASQVIEHSLGQGPGHRQRRR